MILLVTRRNIKERTYGAKIEFKFNFEVQPTIPQLWLACKEHLKLPDGERISLSKYVPHQFEWRWLNPDEVIIEKQGKKKKTEKSTLASEFDMRKFPFLLTDGDIIGVRIESEEGAETDDFQTEADQIAKEDFRIE